MSINVNGLDGFLDLIAVLAFLVAIIVAWVSPGHRMYYALVALGLFCWSLTTIVH